MGRITVPLDKSEAAVLREISARDCRSPHDQMRYLLREAGERRGLISGDEQKIGHLTDASIRETARVQSVQPES